MHIWGKIGLIICLSIVYICPIEQIKGGSVSTLPVKRITRALSLDLISLIE